MKYVVRRSKGYSLLCFMYLVRLGYARTFVFRALKLCATSPASCSEFFTLACVSTVYFLPLQHPREHLRGDPQGRSEHLPDAERLHPQG